MSTDSSSMNVTFLKKILGVAGFDTHRFLFHLFEQNARRIYEQKLRHLDSKTKKIVMEEDERRHLADMELCEAGSQFVVRSFTIDRIQFIRKTVSDDSGTIADFGDSNGIFIRALNRDGLSVNISSAALSSIRAKNLDVIRADLEYLPFRKNSIPTILLFETLEHVPNPIALLREIGRVCSRSLILSIPYVTQTHIHPFNYDPGRPIYQHHIFEFSPDDFARIVTHTGFSLQRQAVATVLGSDATLFEKAVLYLWQKFVEPDTFCGCFRKFYMCELVNTPGGPQNIPARDSCD